MKLRARIVISFVIVTFFSLGSLTYWVNKVARDHEYEHVHEKHLIVAQNLSTGLSRYTQDVLETFEFLVKNSDSWSQSKGIPEILSRFNIRYIAILDSNFKTKSSVLGPEESDLKLPSPEVINELYMSAAKSDRKATFSGIQSFDGSPHFFITQTLSNGQFSIAVFKPDHIVSVQKAVAFGERGHSMIVDQYGQVIAHPNPEWQRQSKDASKLSVVQLMTSGKTGVAEFYSPPMKADMIAGYTNIPETGWGVMVPQPQQELIDTANKLAKNGNFISVFSILLALIFGWWISSVLTRSISEITIAAKKITAGERNARVAPLKKYSPPDLVALANTFNNMLEELEQKNSELALLLSASESENKAKADFLGLMSHEFRTPLTSVIGSLELLDQSDIDDDHKQFVHLASNSATQLLSTLNNVLLLVKLSNNGVTVESAPLDIKRLIQEVLDRVQSQTTLKQNTLEVTYESEIPNGLYGDPKIVRQILLCLAENSNNYTEKGSINITVKFSSTTKKAQVITITIRDNGEFIPLENQKTIFNSFLNSDQSSRKDLGGISFGLDVAFQLTQLIDGEITCNSIQGQDTVFTIHFPIATSLSDNDYFTQ